jgi:hypothetical protein
MMVGRGTGSHLCPALFVGCPIAGKSAYFFGLIFGIHQKAGNTA